MYTYTLTLYVVSLGLFLYSFPEPKITNATFCMSTIYWSPPPCDANCTISVDGQDIGTVPCSVGSLSVESDLSTKTVNITARDQLGRSVIVQAVPDPGLEMPCYCACNTWKLHATMYTIWPENWRELNLVVWPKMKLRDIGGWSCLFIIHHIRNSSHQLGPCLWWNSSLSRAIFENTMCPTVLVSNYFGVQQLERHCLANGSPRKPLIHTRSQWCLIHSQ